MRNSRKSASAIGKIGYKFPSVDHFCNDEIFWSDCHGIVGRSFTGLVFFLIKKNGRYSYGGVWHGYGYRKAMSLLFGWGEGGGGNFRQLNQS